MVFINLEFLNESKLNTLSFFHSVICFVKFTCMSLLADRDEILVARAVI